MKETTIAELDSAARDYVVTRSGPCQALNDHLGVVWQVSPQDACGVVAPVAYMGTEAWILKVARVSTGSNREAAYNPNGWALGEDGRLLRRLFRDRHTSPLEFGEITFFVVCPIFVARQWIRHRTANVSEHSARYAGALNMRFFPQNHGEMDDEQFGKLLETMEASSDASQAAYDELVAAGMATERARVVTGLNTYTRFLWKIDMHNLVSFLILRCAPDAQREIQDYARLMLRQTLYSFSPIAARYVEATLLHRHGRLFFSGGKYTPVGVSDESELLRAVQYYHRNVPELPVIGGGHG